MLEKIKKWLFTPAKTVADKVVVTSSALILNVIWLMGVVALLTFVYNGPWQYQAILFGCILAPLWEELAFRVIPLKIARMFGNDFIIPMVGLSSLIFGWGHGNGTISLLIQGVGGVFLSIVYIKTNYNYWAAVALHAAWNIWALFGTNLIL